MLSGKFLSVAWLRHEGFTTIFEFGLSHRIDLTLKLHATYARSAGMYASQIWSTPLVNPFSALMLLYPSFALLS